MAGALVAAFAVLGSGLVAASAGAAEIEAPASLEQRPAADRQLARWGAIHLSNDGKYGASNKARTKHKANAVAHRKCKKKSNRPCHRIVATSNSCAAVYWRMANGRVKKYGWSKEYNNLRAAKRKARRECRLEGRGNARCRNWVAICTRRPA